MKKQIIQMQKFSDAIQKMGLSTADAITAVVRLQVGNLQPIDQGANLPPRDICPAGIPVDFFSKADPDYTLTIYHGTYSYDFSSIEEVEKEREANWPWLRAICKLAGHHAFENPYFRFPRSGPSYSSTWQP